MCGIFGYINNRDILSNEEINLSRKKQKNFYTEVLIVMVNGILKIFYGIQRLSINDLSENEINHSFLKISINIQW